MVCSISAVREGPLIRLIARGVSILSCFINCQTSCFPITVLPCVKSTTWCSGKKFKLAGLFVDEFNTRVPVSEMAQYATLTPTQPSAAQSSPSVGHNEDLLAASSMEGAKTGGCSQLFSTLNSLISAIALSMFSAFSTAAPLRVAAVKNIPSSSKWIAELSCRVCVAA